MADNTSLLAKLWAGIIKRSDDKYIHGKAANLDTAWLYITNDQDIPEVTSTSVDSTVTGGSASIVTNGGIYAKKSIRGELLFNSVWNDLTDAIVVPEDTELEFGKCYKFDGKEYRKTDKYLDPQYIGIHSDTEGMCLGIRDGIKQLHLAVAGFVLAYVDKEYEPGTPLTCTENGALTAFKDKSDKKDNPELIVATYWKPELSEKYEDKIAVNGRHWVKVK